LHDQGRRIGHGPGHCANHRGRARRPAGRHEQRTRWSDRPFHVADGEDRRMLTAVVPLVFVIDDNLSVRKSLSRLLTLAGYTVETFRSAREFLMREAPAGPCCLVLDVRMPDLTGIEMQEALAAAGRRMSIVFITGYVDVP